MNIWRGVDLATDYRLTKSADLIISSIGGHDYTELELKPTATVVDIGGDFIGVSGIQNYVPFIGGVGPVTRAILMEPIPKFRRAMMQIDSTSICLNCAHLQTVTEDQYYGIERPIVLVECKLEVCAFPCHNNQSCTYFKEKNDDKH